MKGDATTLAGTVNQVVLGNGTLTTSNANSIMKGDATTLAGTAAQYVMGNGTLLTATYTTMTSGTFDVNFSGLTAGATTSLQTLTYRKISNGSISTVFLSIPPFTVSIGTTNSTNGVSSDGTGALPIDLRPSTNPYVPLIATFGGVAQTGWFRMWTTGSISIYPNNLSAAIANTICGIPQRTMISYIL